MRVLIDSVFLEKQEIMACHYKKFIEFFWRLCIKCFSVNISRGLYCKGVTLNAIRVFNSEKMIFGNHHQEDESSFIA